jgi:hypothetical protein
MFYWNVSYHWGLLSELLPPRVIFRASAQSSVDCYERRSNLLDQEERLFDPQFYLRELSLTTTDHQMLISRLCTYPWFGTNPPEFDGSNRAAWFSDIRTNVDSIWQGGLDPYEDWRTTVGAAIDFQLDLGCTRIILPSPIIDDPETTLDDYFALLDGSIQAASRLTELPILASVPFHERAIYSRDPQSSDLLEALADGISARPELDGAYVLLAGDALARDRIGSARVAGAILQLSKLLGNEAQMHVIANFVEALGVAACSVGAAGYGSGYSRKGRRLSLSDYVEPSFGRAFPKFHSLKYALDLLPERDLEKLRDARLLSRFLQDSTDASAPLLQALREGASSSEVNSWEERQNNTSASRKHYLLRHLRGSEQTFNAEECLDWLQAAEENWLYLNSRFEAEPLEAEGNHLTPWRTALERVL